MSFTTGILLETPNKDLIFQHRDDIPNIINPGKVCTFGGHSEGEETPVECALRELEEESTLSLFHFNLELFVHFTLSPPHLEEYIFIAKNINPSKIKVLEGQGYKIVSKDSDLNQINFSTLSRYLIYLYWGI